jgi:ketosteroid isomerase-like protein
VDNAALAHAAWDAAAAGNIAGFLAFFAPDAVVWHNFDQVEQPIAEAAAQLGAMMQHFASISYEDRRYVSLPDGAVMQHVSRVTMKDGRKVNVHTMLRMHARDGRIQRVEEYFDAGAARAAMGG